MSRCAEARGAGRRRAAVVASAALVATAAGGALAVAQTPPVTPSDVPVQALTLPVEDLDLPISSLDGSVSTTDRRVTLQADVLFRFGSARLTGRARSRVAAAVAEVRRRDPDRLVVTGFTDSKGSPGFNLRLSRQRAASVERALVAALGADAPAINARGRGEADPVASNTKEDGSDSPQGRARNRRVELTYG